MIHFTIGDLLKTDAEALVNTVNCVGISGRGVALQFKKLFPENFSAYAAACKRDEVQPGRMFVYETGRLTNPRYIINFPTKRHWRGKSRMEDIETGLDALIGEVRRLGIHSVALPPLGSGLGGLEWSQVRSRIEKAFAGLTDVQITVFEPSGSPEVVRSSKTPKMTAGRATLVGLMHRYLRGLLDPFITLLEVHKLMYFMQEAGERLSLRYTKAPYGPYAENLRHVLNSIEGHLISGYLDGGDEPDKLLELVPGAVEDAESFLDDNVATSKRFDTVVDLVTGFETSFGMELLSSTHWVATRDHATTPEDAVSRLYDWNERKRKFSEEQIRLAWDMLADKGWLRGSGSH